MNLKQYLSQLKSSALHSNLPQFIRLKLDKKLAVFNITTGEFDKVFTIDSILLTDSESDFYFYKVTSNNYLEFFIISDKLDRFDYIRFNYRNKEYLIFANIRVLIEFLLYNVVELDQLKFKILRELIAVDILGHLSEVT